MRRGLASLPAAAAAAAARLRNIGISAHVDAGKTTVCERLLFFANKTQGMGEVHDGASTMDYLPQERERGITINSAAISFAWKDHQINLIDTPGHFDFGFEVERSMRVMDGSVIVLDSVHGVEAQTEQVWRQASRYAVPRIVLANKMDRDGASAELCITSMKKRLGVTAIPLQLPLGQWSQYRGHIDLVNLTKVTWPERGGADLGRTFATSPITAAGADLELAMPAREAMLELLADLDDEFAAVFLSTDNVPSDAIKKALTRTVLAQVAPVPGTRPAVPLIYGAALRNTGMQPVLDAVVDYLPSPDARAVLLPDRLPRADPSAPLSALVFKVQHDPIRGPLVFVRIYAGRLSVKDSVKGSQGVKEKVQGLLRAEANEFFNVESGYCQAGDVCVLLGCDSLRTGDSLGPGPALEGFSFPPPIFSVSLELESISQEAKLDTALAIATRDDPSLSYGVDAETGQLLLSGVGELHLEVAVDRLRREHGLELHVGKPSVALREHVAGEGQAQFLFDKIITGHRALCTVEVSIRALAQPSSQPRILSAVPISPELRVAMITGANAGLSRGPTMGLPVRGVEIKLTRMMPEYPMPAALRGAVAGAVGLLLRQRADAAQVLEPMLKVVCKVPEASTGVLLSELTGRRRANIVSVDSVVDDSIIEALVPAAEMLDFAKGLRSLTGGHGSFATSFAGYDVAPESALPKLRH